MQRFTYFSRHALHRLSQRSRLTFEHLARLLDAGAYVDMGTKPGMRREHLLFYSPLDDACFVAIRDESMGTIVTVLPLDFHATLAWPVSTDQCAAARDAFTRSASLVDELAQPPPRQTSFRVTVHFLDANGRPKAKLGAKFDASDYNFDTARLVSEKDFITTVLDSAEEAGIPRSTVSSITVRLGKKNPVPFSIEQREMPL
jgi:hypothetical protein